jgi:transcriptional regulator with GAF, ATPase, and Fis domain
MARAADTNQTEDLGQRPAAIAACRLLVVDGPDVGLCFDLSHGDVCIGTDPQCGLRLNDSAVSRRHARVEATAQGLCVRDLDSKNGTLYLGTRLAQAVLPIGAVLVLGRTRVALTSLPSVTTGAPALTRYGALLGVSPPMQALYAVLKRLERSDYTVLIQGETGVGKELVARELHARSTRSEAAFEVFDCGAVPPNLIESELFGHVRGAFTGAEQTHDGVFVRADGGTLLLDEIGELELLMQPKLLRALETREVLPLGGRQRRAVDVRVLAATNRDLAQAVKDGLFRSDLYFRLNVVVLRIPPLRERREDIPLLVRHFLDALAPASAGMNVSPETLDLLCCGYDWPGNVRELKNALAQVVSLGTMPDAIAGHVRPSGAGAAPASASAKTAADEPYLAAKKRVLDAFERDYLKNQLDLADQNIAQAARLSQMDRSYFKRLLRRHGLLPERER